MLEIKNVSKQFNEKGVLSNCSLTCQNGSIVGLVGINGAGKSTLLRCICGIYQCDAGQILLGGQPIYENDGIKKEMMFLSDDPYLSSSMTIKDLKDFYTGFYPTFNELDYKKYLSKFHLDENMQLKKLSKGMKRQALILIILSFRPKLLVLDESFDGLDPLVRKTMKKAISNLVSENNSIVLVSSHSLHDLESICDHVALIQNGTISSYEDVDDNKDVYHRYQLVFEHSMMIEEFSRFEIIDIEIRSKFVTIIVKGNEQEILTKLNSLKPLMLEELDLSLEELFVAKMKGGKYDI